MRLYSVTNYCQSWRCSCVNQNRPSVKLQLISYTVQNNGISQKPQSGRAGSIKVPIRHRHPYLPSHWATKADPWVRWDVRWGPVGLGASDPAWWALVRPRRSLVGRLLTPYLNWLSSVLRPGGSIRERMDYYSYNVIELGRQTEKNSLIIKNSYNCFIRKSNMRSTYLRRAV